MEQQFSKIVPPQSVPSNGINRVEQIQNSKPFSSKRRPKLPHQKQKDFSIKIEIVLLIYI